MTDYKNLNNFEREYVRGSQAAYLSILQHCIAHSGIDRAAASRTELLVERARIVAALRDLCATHGDNDWDDNLDLEDVIRKHLAEHLQE